MHNIDTVSLDHNEVSKYSPRGAPLQSEHTPYLQRDSSIQRMDNDRVETQHSLRSKQHREENESYVSLPQIKDNYLEGQMS